mmetsp:Transcript_123244/g.359852  ORF Transcript_123244/g.359852 Transcript_123244/m.359852 type:complete len:245 (+) Transcript_123244:818-1552(+)
MKKQRNVAIRRYAFLPWQKTRFPRNLNWEMAMSHACTAADPSLPRMPTPMWAPWIIGTSFAPSPMESVMALAFCLLTSSTSSRFCMGESRQQTQLLLPSARSYSAFCALWLERICAMEAPSITMPRNAADVGPVWLPCDSRLIASSGEAAPTDVYSCMPSSKSLQDFAISTAVSTLSPVNTQTRMPASRSVATVSGTPSCRRSSRAVTPQKDRPTSASAETVAMRSARPSMAARASSHFLLQAE